MSTINTVIVLSPPEEIRRNNRRFFKYYIKMIENILSNMEGKEREDAEKLLEEMKAMVDTLIETSVTSSFEYSKGIKVFEEKAFTIKQLQKEYKMEKSHINSLRREIDSLLNTHSELLTPEYVGRIQKELHQILKSFNYLKDKKSKLYEIKDKLTDYINIQTIKKRFYEKAKEIAYKANLPSEFGAKLSEIRIKLRAKNFKKFTLSEIEYLLDEVEDLKRKYILYENTKKTIAANPLNAVFKELFESYEKELKDIALKYNLDDTERKYDSIMKEIKGLSFIDKEVKLINENIKKEMRKLSEKERTLLKEISKRIEDIRYIKTLNEGFEILKEIKFEFSKLKSVLPQLRELSQMVDKGINTKGDLEKAYEEVKEQKEKLYKSLSSEEDVRQLKKEMLFIKGIEEFIKDISFAQEEPTHLPSTEEQKVAYIKMAKKYFDFLKDIDKDKARELNKTLDIEGLNIDMISQRLKLVADEVKLTYGKIKKKLLKSEVYKDDIREFMEKYHYNEIKEKGETLLEKKYITDSEYNEFLGYVADLRKQKEKEEKVEFIRQNLRNLGYEIADESDMEKLHKGDTVYFDTEFGKEYKIAVRIGKDGSINTQLIRYVQNKNKISTYEMQKDIEIAKRWCGKYDGFLDNLAEKGYVVDIKYKKPPEEGISYIEQKLPRREEEAREEQELLQEARR